MDTGAAPADGEGAPRSVVIGVSIAVPDPFGKEVQDARDSFGDPLARSIPTHVTLLPPTEVPVADLPAVQEHLRTVAARHRPFPMLLLGTGTFRPVSPVVFVRVEEGMQECREVEASVRSGPLARELNFPFHPHVTVAHNLPDDALDRAYEEMRGFRASFEVPGYSLYRFGADEVWRPLHAYAFGAS
ncbi:2'-5' RNA ligase family protein [Streptomyces sp. NPDC001380]|uniref:2'-5' RNA ligase family protein n=1 Tax=Streptomyces sp. NPDC001380 TaxID=3364566 RepID=UPI0036880019